MFVVNDDMSIYLTRGDIAFFTVTADNNGVNYKFQPGDIVRIKVTEKKACENVMFQKDFPITEETERVEILLTEEETKIGEVISKPTDYWYEIELNPYTNPQTIVGYDEDGAKIFKLFPEGRDLGPDVEPEDIPVVDEELSLTSDRPVQNQAISRALVKINESVERAEENTEAAMDKTEEAARHAQVISEGKVDKGGREQITYAMLSQEVKEAMTGGNTPVVGENAVNTSNIVNGAVTVQKLDPMTLSFKGYSNGDLKIPFLIINRNEKTAVVNEDFKNQITGVYLNVFGSIGIISIPLDSLYVDTSEWSGGANFSLHYDKGTNTMKVANGTTLKSGLYRLGYYFGEKMYDMPFSFTFDGRYFKYGTDSYDESLQIGKSVQAYYAHTPLGPDKAVFTVDFASGTVEINRSAGSPNCFHASRAFQINFATVTYTVEKVATHYAVLYDLVKNHIYFDNFPSNAHDDCVFLGLVCSEPEKASFIFPYKTANGLFYYPGRTGRLYADMFLSFTENYGTSKIPYVDFDNHCLVIPGGVNLYGVYGEGFRRLLSTYDMETKITYDPSERYVYLVGTGEGMLNFVGGNVYQTLESSFAENGMMYLGCIDTLSKTINLHCDCGIGKSVSILGDSISTYEGYIPDGNAVYYTGSRAGVSDVRQTWWKRAIDALGYKLNTNNSWSGDRVTGRGITRATQLDDGTNPDIIIVYLGINDFNGNIALGSYNGRGAVPSATNTFREAYANMLKAMLKKYTTSKVYACTLVTDQYTTDEVEAPEVNGAGVYLSEYNDAIREIAKAFCVEVIDLESCGITIYNGKQYMGDYNESTSYFLHPNAEGHRLIAETVIKALK